MSTFKSWYSNPENAKTLAERRKQRYHNDPEYREKVKQRRREYGQRMSTRVKPAPGMLTLEQAEADVGVSKNQMLEYRRRGLVPPFASYSGTYYVTPYQVQLLHRLREFFRTHPRRLSEGQKQELADLASLIALNWS